MYKKILSVIMIAGFVLLGCDDKPDDGTSGGNGANLSGLPYSQLTPEQQKQKLENESIELLRLANGFSNLEAVDAMEYLEELLDRRSIDFGDKAINKTSDIYEFADLYRVITWNPASGGSWTVTESNSTLSIRFPASSSSTTNNAVFSTSNVVTSNVEVTVVFQEWVDEECIDGEWYGGYFYCYWWEDIYEDKEAVLRMPSSVTATLNIGNTQAASFEFTAEYSGNNPLPVKIGYKMTAGAYTYATNFQRGAENKVEASLRHNNTVMFDALIQTGTKFDELFDLIYQDGVIDEDNANDLDEDDILDLLGDVFGHIRIMDDLSILYRGDVKNLIKEGDGFFKEADEFWGYWDQIEEGGRTYGVAYFHSDDGANHFTRIGQRRRAEADDDAALFNKNVKAELISRTDGTKIADMTLRSEKTDEHWDAWEWIGSRNRWEIKYYEISQQGGTIHLNPVERKLYDYYSAVPYLKFGDNTFVEAEVYFSSGFDRLESEWRDFVDSFEREP